MHNLRAFTYIFDDTHWLKKMGELALFGVLCFTPVIGLIPLCALLGYLTEIIHNVMNDYPRPLPEWDHIGEDVGKGFHVLVALVLYSLPAFVAIVALNAIGASLGESLFGEMAALGLFTLLLPLLFIYALVAGTVFAIGFARYADTWEKDELYRIGPIINSIRDNFGLTLQWLIASLAASIALAALTPLLGLGAILFFPTHGYLIGTFGRRLRAQTRNFRLAA